MPGHDESQGWHPGHNPWAIALTVTVATFMEVMDVSIANVALPHIAGGLSAGLDESTWILTSYLVSNAVVLPISVSQIIPTSKRVIVLRPARTMGASCISASANTRWARHSRASR